MNVDINCIDSENDFVMLEISEITLVCAGTIMMIMMTENNDNQVLSRQDAYGDIIMGYGMRSRQVGLRLMGFFKT